MLIPVAIPFKYSQHSQHLSLSFYQNCGLPLRRCEGENVENEPHEEYSWTLSEVCPPPLHPSTLPTTHVSLFRCFDISIE